MKPKPEDLTEILRRLSLTFIAQHYEAMSQEAAREQLGHVEYLRRLAEGEAAARYERSVQRRIKAAHLPVLKTLEQFNWGWPSKLNRAQVQDLFRLRFIEQKANVVFIGGVGLGKTHLLQAIGNHILKKFPNFNIMYASAEKFSNDFISSVKDGDAKNFQHRYRHIDLLLIDDIQFISGKEHTQESFFHTFNELHQQNKQVIMTSDRPPKAIPALEDRLKSRFEWGMIVDVAPPDLETRIAILQKKCMEKNFPLSQEILLNVATIIQRNIRELEGALNKIIAYHQLKNMEPTVASVKTILSSLEIKSMNRSVTAQQIIDAACQFYSINNVDILGQSREKKFSMPRQIIMHLLRKELNMSYPAIGNELGGRDHTTAMHADNKIIREMDQDLKLRQEIELIKQKLYVNNI